MRSHRIPNVLVVGAGALSSALFLALVARGADLDSVWRAMKGASLWQVIVAAAVLQVTYALQALRWRVLVGGSRRLLRYHGLVIAGVGVNSLFPLRTGDILRARWLARHERISTARAIGSVFRDRTGDVVALFGLLVLTIPLVRRGAWLAWVAVGGLLLVLLIAAVVVASLSYSRRRPRERLESRSTVRRIARDILDDLAAGVRRRRVAGALALSVAAWCVWAAAAGIICHSVGVDVSVAELLFATAVINLGVAIPSSPGFIGTYQWLAVAAFGAAAVAAEAALAVAVLVQAAWLVPTTLAGGAVALLELRREAASYADRVRATT